MVLTCSQQMKKKDNLGRPDMRVAYVTATFIALTRTQSYVTPNFEGG